MIRVYITFLIVFGTFSYAFAFKPMLGHVTERTAVIVVDTMSNYKINNIQTGNNYGTEGMMPFMRFPFSRTKFELDDLEPGKDYDISMFNTKTGTRDTLSFSTPRLWAFRGDPPELTVSFGSCTFVNDEPYDRPGRGYGRGTDIYNSIASMNPDMHISLGDNWYYRESDWSSKAGMSYRINQSRSDDNLTSIFGIPNYGVWDDHDFGPNDSDRSFPLKKEALDLFNQSWGNPSPLNTDSYYTSFVRDGVEFILLDNRTFRAPNDYPDDMADKDYFGEQQLQWLKDKLISSNEWFKVVCTGGQVLNPSAEFETYARFSKEREELLSFIEDNNIRGVIFLTGDRHYTELTLHPEFPIIDYTSSPISSGPYEKGCESANTWKVDGSCYADNNFGTITFKGERKDRVAVMRCFSDDGTLVWEKQWDGKRLK
jgi:alkaline phosphatase D